MRNLLIGLVLAASATSVFAQAEQMRPTVFANETILRVSGKGTVVIAPENMEISIGVVTAADDTKAALEANNLKVEPVVAALREFGIPARDIRTTDVEIDPRYSENDDADEPIVGWTVRNVLTVRTDRLKEAGDLVSLLVEAGGNIADSLEFGLTPDTRQRVSRDAEAKALAEAQSQAQHVAETLGMRVSRILLVSDGNVRFTDGSGFITVTGSRIRRPSTEIEPGENEVTATYDVEFALVPK